MILLTGGSGRLGTALRGLMSDLWAPSRRELDITAIKPDLKAKIMGCQLIVHMAAYTNVNRAEKEDRKLCFQTNVIGTRNLARFGVPMLYISTDSVFDGETGLYKESDQPYPRNFYSLSKYLGELEAKDGVILRCCPKTRPWAHEVACTDRFFSAQYFDEIALKIKRAIQIYKILPKIIHVGGPRLSHYELALQTRPDVRPIEIGEYPVYRGKDWSLDCSLWRAME